MPACPRDNDYSSLAPPGFTQDDSALKRVQLVELLHELIEKCHREPEFIDEQSKQTALLIATAQYALLPTSNPTDEKREFVQRMIALGQELWAHESQNDDREERSAPIHSSSPSNDTRDVPSTVSLSDTPSNDDEADFSLDDLANEYLRSESSPSSSNEKTTPPEEPALAPNESSKYGIVTQIAIIPVSIEPALKSPLEAILFADRRSSIDDDTDCLWTTESSPFAQMFCRKIDDSSIMPVQRMAVCLFDRSLYRRLTHLVALLPKQCIRNSAPQVSFRPPRQQQQQQQQQQAYRSPRPPMDHWRPNHRPSFPQNLPPGNGHPRTRPPNFYQHNNPPGPHQYVNTARYPNEQRPVPQQYPQYINGPPQPMDHAYQPRGPPKHVRPEGAHQQQKKQSGTPPSHDNQQAPRPNQRPNNKKNSGASGHRMPDDRSTGPGSHPR